MSSDILNTLDALRAAGEDYGLVAVHINDLDGYMPQTTSRAGLLKLLQDAEDMGLVRRIRSYYALTPKGEEVGS